MFQYPIPKRVSLSSLYDEGYYTGDSDYHYYDEREKKRCAEWVYRSRLKRILGYVEQGGKERKFLDIGCGFGGLLQTAKDFYDFDIYCVELSRYAGNYVRDNITPNVFIDFVEDVKLPKNFFDVVTMIEVIEHLFDPVSVLKKVYRSLKKNGLLVIQTADIYGLQSKVLKDRYRYYLPGHIFYFSKYFFKTFLREVGFRKVKIYGIDISLLSKLMKKRCDFSSLKDYLYWIRIIFYHLFTKFNLTSSMVVYAVK